MGKRKLQGSGEANQGFGGTPPGEKTPSPALLYDSVTDLPTVPLLLEDIRKLLEERQNLGILSVSLVQTEKIEQLFGWGAFDDLIRQLALVLLSIKKDHLRRDDIVSEVMVSGNAFVVVLSPPRRKERISYHDLDMVRQRVQKRLREYLKDRLPGEISERFGLYVGGAILENSHEIRFERLVYQALEQAYADSIGEKEKARHKMSQALQDILNGGLVHAVYQPVVCLPERKVIGYEALSRVPTEKFDNIGTLFKTAHEDDVIWRLERLCREKAFSGLSTRMPADQILFLNVEPDSIRDPQLQSKDTQKLLEKAHLSPNRIVLEMTERSAVHDFAAFRKTLKYFQDQGFKLAIDDVGSGYSGLQSIAEVCPDYIKLDMSLIRDIHQKSIKKELVSTVFRFSRSTGIRLIAEGVEQIEELRTLQEIGIEFAQGYLFAHPEKAFPETDLSTLEKPSTK